MKPPSTTTKQSPTNEPANQETKTVVALLGNATSCYLTAHARICNPVMGSFMTVRIFLDCDCNKTFVLRRIANDLQLKHHENAGLVISVFLRPEIEEIQTEIVQLEILDPETDKPYLITAHTVPQITDDIVTMNASSFRSRYPQMASLNLADEANNEEIFLLIGNNFFMDIH